MGGRSVAVGVGVRESAGGGVGAEVASGCSAGWITVGVGAGFVFRGRGGTRMSGRGGMETGSPPKSSDRISSSEGEAGSVISGSCVGPGEGRVGVRTGGGEGAGAGRGARTAA